MLLSEVKDSAILKIREEFLSKETLLNNLENYKGEEIYTTKTYKVNIDARSMLGNALFSEFQNMYDDWDLDILKNIQESDIQEIQGVVNRILNRGNNVSYCKDELVKIDIDV